MTNQPIRADDALLLTHSGLRQTMFLFCWSDRALLEKGGVGQLSCTQNMKGSGSDQAVATSSISPISITIKTRGDRMDQNNYAADESTALASSRQQTVGAKGTSGVPSWNAVSANQSGCDIFELFEVYRRSANRYLNQYFECLDRLPASSTELGAYSRSQEVSTRDGSEAEKNVWLLKISHDSAVRDLTVLDEILDKAKEQEKPPRRTVSPGAAAWTFACSILAFAVPHKVSSAIFKVGALAGALLFTFGLLRKQTRVSRLGPVQHKIQGLIRSFEEGTMRHRDRGEVLVSPLDSITRR